MIANKDFEIVQVADEYLAVPVGKQAEKFKGIIALTETAAFLLKNLDVHRNKDSLIQLLTEEYDVDRNVAEEDLEKILVTFLEVGLIEN